MQANRPLQECVIGGQQDFDQRQRKYQRHNRHHNGFAQKLDRNLVAGLLASGMLAEIAPNPPVSVAEGHWFVALPDRLRVRQVRLFRDWLISEAAAAQTLPLQHSGNLP